MKMKGLPRLPRDTYVNKVERHCISGTPKQSWLMASSLTKPGVGCHHQDSLLPGQRNHFTAELATKGDLKWQPASLWLPSQLDTAKVTVLIPTDNPDT